MIFAKINIISTSDTKMRKKTAIFFITFSVIVLAGVAVTFRYARMLSAPVTNIENFRIFIRPSDTNETVFKMIADSDPSARLDGLKLWSRLRKCSIRPGCYTIVKGKGARETMNTLSSGSQTPVRLVINSVRTVEQMAGNIAGQLMLDSVQILRCLTDKTFLDSVGYTPQTVFCTIIPNTYEVYWTIAPEALMARLLKESNQFWNDSRSEKARQCGLTRNEVLTLASIVEEETAMTSDMPIIAGLFMNRLKRNMPLQSCPTVIYALGGERPKRVLTVHLEVESPYNTYKHTGLPPGPIRFASIQAIDAVLNYSHHNYLYMCASDKLDGHTLFATTLAEHNRNAQRYQHALDMAGIYK